MGDIFATCDRNIQCDFQFLIDEFGFKGPERTLYEGPRGCLYHSYSNKTTGIRVGYDNECSSFNLFLSRQGPAGDPVMEGSAEVDNTCRLEWILEVLNPVEAERYERTRSIQAQITLSAALLKQECADILRGGFSVFKRVKKHLEDKELIDQWSKWFKLKYPVRIVCRYEPLSKGNEEIDSTRPCAICKKALYVELPFHKIFIDHRTAVPVCEECLKGYKPHEPRILFDAFDTSVLHKASPDLQHSRRYIPSSFHFLIEE